MDRLTATDIQRSLLWRNEQVIDCFRMNLHCKALRSIPASVIPPKLAVVGYHAGKICFCVPLLLFAHTPVEELHGCNRGSGSQMPTSCYTLLQLCDSPSKLSSLRPVSSSADTSSSAHMTSFNDIYQSEVTHSLLQKIKILQIIKISNYSFTLLSPLNSAGDGVASLVYVVITMLCTLFSCCSYFNDIELSWASLASCTRNSAIQPEFSSIFSYYFT